ncbi:MAG: hypothetical protein HY819_09205 [Acidobacteria bacterium]|nr:hypothetical protein [Acidobacteriota bacterium]
MRKIFVLIFFILFTTTLAMAQSKESTPKTELFLGNSYVRTEVGRNLEGFNASMTSNINKSWGITGDFGAYSSTGSNIYTLMAGPRYSLRLNNGKFIPFTHALFGAITNDTARFTMVYGGGLDLKVNSFVAVRAFQADYLQIRADSRHTNNVRFSFGIVFHFGN